MLSFGVFVKLDRTAVSSKSFPISGRLHTLTEKPVVSLLYGKRSLKPVLTRGFDEVKLRTLHTRIFVCLLPTSDNVSDENEASLYKRDLEEGLLDGNFQALERTSQDTVDEDSISESDKESIYGDDVTKNIAPKWYLLQVTRGRERSVRDTLLSKAENTKMLNGRLLNVLVPCFKKVVLSPRGIPKVRMEPVFSGYVLVKLIMTDSAYRSIKETLFVVGFVSFGNKGKRKIIPEPLRDSEAEEILRKVEAKYPKSDLAFSVGDKVQVQTSEMNAYGIVSETEKECVKVACLLEGSAATVEATVDSLRLVKDEEFEAAVKEYIKSRQAKPRQTKKKKKKHN
ncbi:transcriptional antiterminator NusG [Galdieria sulphuraria]|uniref:Transcriptional antiterminator NusG n=1 Tax=Galdieria sulphuraria TaxID=130081 RepID=M2W3D6_GALSU|nr:transcriptional antiterminator NusG [Galdieria sulphuraria]EME30211.1 transcriptional antiterminator NusG [Galdieria sulphuraria]|eukprot:XP_005706731.1 transcriptional antiterminator NusG [Galdieria sulphuraria]